MKGRQILDGRRIANHEHSLDVSNDGEILERAGVTFRQRLFHRFPHRGDRSFGAFLLGRCDARLAGDRLSAGGNGVFPLSRSHVDLPFQPTGRGNW